MVQYGYSYGNLAENMLTMWQKPDKPESIPHTGYLAELPPQDPPFPFLHQEAQAAATTHWLAYKSTTICNRNVFLKMTLRHKVLFFCPSTKLELENIWF